MISTTLAIAADYADAIAVARRAKNWCFLLLLLVLVAQLAVFLVARYDQKLLFKPAPAAMVDEHAPQRAAVADARGAAVMQYVIDLTDFLGLITAIVLAIVLLLLVGIMLVGRLVGVAHMTGAFVGAAVLVVLLFPWQAFLNQSPDPWMTVVRIPGVLYTWPELVQFCRFDNSKIAEAILHWSRFVGWPAAALIVLAGTQSRANRGLAMSLGETDMTASVPKASA